MLPVPQWPQIPQTILTNQHKNAKMQILLLSCILHVEQLWLWFYSIHLLISNNAHPYLCRFGSFITCQWRRAHSLRAHLTDQTIQWEKWSYSFLRSVSHHFWRNNLVFSQCSPLRFYIILQGVALIQLYQYEFLIL